jgi:hypothetical protein
MQLVERTDDEKAADLSAPVSVSWTFSTVRIQFVKQIIAITLMIAVSAFAMLLFHSVLVALAAGAAIFLSIADIILPLTYRIDRESVTVKFGPIEILEISRESAVSLYRTSDGLKLSPFKKPAGARLEPFRGVKLSYPKAQEAEIISFLASEWGLNL